MWIISERDMAKIDIAWNVPLLRDAYEAVVVTRGQRDLLHTVSILPNTRREHASSPNMTPHHLRLWS